MEGKLYSISDIASELQYSKTYIYRIFNNNKQELKQYTKIVKGVTYLTADGYQLIENLLKPNADDIDEDEIDYQQELINSLQEEVLFLRGQLQSQTEIVKREQQLRMTESQNILLLEAQVKEVDQQLSSWREKTSCQATNNKGFFSKIFKRQV